VYTLTNGWNKQWIVWLVDEHVKVLGPKSDEEGDAVDEVLDEAVAEDAFKRPDSVSNWSTADITLAGEAKADADTYRSVAIDRNATCKPFCTSISNNRRTLRSLDSPRMSYSTLIEPDASSTDQKRLSLVMMATILEQLRDAMYSSPRIEWKSKRFEVDDMLEGWGLSEHQTRVNTSLVLVEQVSMLGGAYSHDTTLRPGDTEMNDRLLVAKLNYKWSRRCAQRHAQYKQYQRQQSIDNTNSADSRLWWAS
jgi:hypothetical protein